MIARIEERLMFKIPEPGDVDIDGYLVGPNFERIGMCDECGRETVISSPCCTDADVVPIT